MTEKLKQAKEELLSIYDENCRHFQSGGAIHQALGIIEELILENERNENDGNDKTN